MDEERFSARCSTIQQHGTWDTSAFFWVVWWIQFFWVIMRGSNSCGESSSSTCSSVSNTCLGTNAARFRIPACVHLYGQTSSCWCFQHRDQKRLDGGDVASAPLQASCVGVPSHALPLLSTFNDACLLSTSLASCPSGKVTSNTCERLLVMVSL